MLFQSIHLHGNSFYPGTGAFCDYYEGQQQQFYPGGVSNLPMFPGTATSSKWRKLASEKLIPRLIEFAPDFILISAGFDAHEKDHIHGAADTRITEFEYEWLTK